MRFLACKFSRKTAIKFQKRFCVTLFQKFITDYHLEIDFFTLLHETEAEAACDHITVTFECQDGRYVQIVVEKEVSHCISLY